MKRFWEMLHRNSDAPTMTNYTYIILDRNIHPAVNYVETSPVWLKILCIELSILLTEMAKEW
jgi:hypothetical protein